MDEVIEIVDTMENYFRGFARKHGYDFKIKFNYANNSWDISFKRKGGKRSYAKKISWDFIMHEASKGGSDILFFCEEVVREVGIALPKRTKKDKEND